MPAFFNDGPPFQIKQTLVTKNLRPKFLLVPLLIMFQCVARGCGNTKFIRLMEYYMWTLRLTSNERLNYP